MATRGSASRASTTGRASRLTQKGPSPRGAASRAVGHPRTLPPRSLVDPGQAKRPVLGPTLDAETTGFGVPVPDPRVSDARRHSVLLYQDVANRTASSLVDALGIGAAGHGGPSCDGFPGRPVGRVPSRQATVPAVVNLQ